MLPIDMTSTWIPLALLAVLCAYMIHLFRLERREALAFEGMAPSAPAPATAPAATSGGAHDAGHAPAAAPVEDAAHVAPAPAVHAEPAPAAHAEPAPKKRRAVIWRGWAMRIWVPLVVGLAGQAYLDLIRPLVEKVTAH